MNVNAPILPAWTGVPILVALVVGAIWSVRRLFAWRRTQAWHEAARELGGALEVAGGKMRVKGRFRERPAFLSEAVSHEDAIPYPHTRGSLNIRNPARVVMGLRHKSLLEEVTTRNDTRPVETGDRDFDRAFFLLITVPAHVEALLTDEARRSLKRFADVEIYLRGTQIEWRRADTVTSTREIVELFQVISDMADTLESLPVRPISLSEAVAEEALIEKGV